MSKVNTIIGNYFKYGGLTSEPSFSKLLIYSQYSTHYSHKMTQLQKNKLYYQKGKHFDCSFEIYRTRKDD
jgi:hypothetical protein